MQKLPEQYRQVLQLIYLEDFSVPEVCTILGKDPKQIYNLLTRARSSLRTELEKEGITHEDL
jgi:RNA polymerase sigma-70 factor (ECF subfamily)